ncbi:MAG: TRAP transporter large permease [Gammaproteobacteria bacterium]|nr:TRAP transporter large permease [Gammaproteobacteria bacterium]
MNEALIMFLVMIGAIAFGIPIPVAVGLGTLVGYFIIDIPFVALAQAMYTGVEPFPLLTVPLFVFAGSLMERGGLALRIVTIARSLIGNYTGSLGLVAVLGCTFFAALSGSGPATTAAIGAVMIPAMLKDKYDPAFGGAIVASGGALGSLIPPSNLMVIYGIVSDNSIPRLFLAGILPGILASALLMLCTWMIARNRNYRGAQHDFAWGPVVAALWDGKWAVGAPFIILGGIYSGIFTPTEAASVAVVYAFLVGAFIHRELNMAKIVQCMKVTAMISGAVLIIVGPAKAFGELASLMDVPDLIGEFLSDFTDSRFVLLMVIAGILIITGMFLESIAQIILLTPLMLPIAISVGIDPIVFGILMVIACEVGFLTPPVGANLFVAARLTNLGIDRISIAVIPFVFVYILVIVIISLFPELVTYLPNLVYGVSG